jgi:cell division septation protein DedD
MAEEKVAALADKPEKSGIKVASVVAGALAAVTAALLGSTLGVAGTVLGAGVASVVTSVGGELYLRSLRRTREAAQRAKALGVIGARRAGSKEPDPEIVEQEAETSQRRWKLRWALIIGTSVLAFSIAILAIIGLEGATGKTFGGGNGTTIGKIVGGGSGPTTTQEQPVPVTSETTPTDTTQPSASTPTATATTTPPSTTTSAPPTTTSAPSTTTTPTSTGAPAPTTTQSAPTTQSAHASAG